MVFYGDVTHNLTQSKLIYSFVIPSVLRDKIFRKLHEGHVSAHLGMQKLLSLVKERFH